jgi:ribonuclease HI
MYYYAVHIGKEKGIFNTWDECKSKVIGYPNSRFKKFKLKKNAKFFVENGYTNEDKNKFDDEYKLSELNNNDNIFNIYTDGSLIKKNDKKYCGYGIYIPKLNKKISKPLKGKKTNNRAELTAIIKSFKYFNDEDGDIIKIYTDSKYSILIFTSTGEKYKNNNFKNNYDEDIPNKDLVIKALKLKNKYNFEIHHVKSHTNNTDEHSIGNKIADELANKGALMS